ncbi:hypothetical protein P152DRAFT_446746 [Eremomyces bilateralis CBS 781.70]|uniref:C2H2-type domain-containing protein n=1 Tax=Eremomyces bilateralis CBS 781.70 TaxID=1392243 RepID=A0A6G1GCX2_9PEZI|nr:uncharacterized protein P152DRAFT_446746 [Eremomyces bilateralis CBS 781.70]KAF1815709.1 hypothetical protein P152DRAFT_446746 [Eremomyces bilateralis CBS 781.70]
MPSPSELGLKSGSKQHPDIYRAIRVYQLINQLRNRLKPRVRGSISRIEGVSFQDLAKDAASSTEATPPSKVPGGTKKSRSITLEPAHRVTKSRNWHPEKRWGEKAFQLKDMTTNHDIGESFLTNPRGGFLKEIDDKGNGFAPEALRDIASDDKRFLDVLANGSGGQLFENLSLFNVADKLGHVETALLFVYQQAVGDKLSDSALANLEHLLRILSDWFISWIEKTIVEEFKGRCSSWMARLKAVGKLGGDLWCSEYRNNERPISTTWPWSIKPALAVLWGVCWQYYCPPGGAIGQLRTEGPWGGGHVRTTQQHNGSVFASNYSNTTPQPIRPEANSVTFPWEPSFFGDQQFHHHQVVEEPNPTTGIEGVINSARTTRDTEVGLTVATAQAVIPFPPIHADFCLAARAGNLPEAPAISFNDPRWHQEERNSIATRRTHITAYFPQPNYAPYLSSRSPREAQQHSYICSNLYDASTPEASIPVNSQNLSRSPVNSRSINSRRMPETAVATATMGLQHNIAPELQQMTDPALDHANAAQIPIDEKLLSRTGQVDAEEEIEHMDDSAMSPGQNEPFSNRRGWTYKREGEPPKNEQNKFICAHPQCAHLMFDRKCEWGKHMDKHERPYKCRETGCEKLQGFTYSGGLLRHQREVHKLHGGTKITIYCPEPACKRHHGPPFTRKENLQEHLRRVHRRESGSMGGSPGLIDEDGNPDTSHMVDELQASAAATDPNIEPNLGKRRRTDDGKMNGYHAVQSDQQSEIERLMVDNAEKDSRLRKLELENSEKDHRLHRLEELVAQLGTRTGLHA